MARRKPDEQATYRAIHGRLAVERGPARLYACAECGGCAREWAYDYSDPTAKSSSQGPFSVDLERYRPLCASCHKFEDTRRAGRSKCGTEAGYYRHRRRGEPQCAFCKSAHADATQRRSTARRTTTEPTDTKD